MKNISNRVSINHVFFTSGIAGVLFLNRQHMGKATIKVTIIRMPAAITADFRGASVSTKSKCTYKLHYSKGLPFSGSSERKNRGIGLHTPEHLYTFSMYSVMSQPLSVFLFKFSKSDYASAVNPSGNAPVLLSLAVYQAKKQS